MEEILDVIHKTIYQFFDVCDDDEEVPLSEKDKLLLKVNKTICNNLKALEQESCEDAVSRQDLLKIYEDRFLELQKLKRLKENKGAEDRQMGVNYCINILKKMPSVTPQPKTGHWINAYPDIEPDPMLMYGICSACGFKQSISDKLKFCPNCGAKMI